LRGSDSEVLAVIPQEYLIVRQQGIGQVANPIAWFWMQLGKANLLLGQIEYDKYKSLDSALKRKGVRPEERQEAWGPLKEAGRLWTLSQAYDACYGESFYYLQVSEDRLYTLLTELNVHEMRVIRDSIEHTNEEYKLPEHLRLMQRFVDKRFGSLLSR
jgi:hypothetical protein